MFNLIERAYEKLFGMARGDFRARRYAAVTIWVVTAIIVTIGVACVIWKSTQVG